ncbi:hypothetical protein N7509_011836 [Penicillium cosmopolitanum]|uniref:Methyltransferase domain-containing protein n=1 Tax=Penicillium cosmopolitanum TaxID=1131564 RepID=A0A9W9VE75_9EURO|nr:uncharacterized protein N7509_011836 [Penicillium cosmopolitanum]KAJ5378717.1 hypothetical protein N7509_011836 [Penicillium cosmopolitanum]
MADDAPIAVDPNIYLNQSDDWQSETTSIGSSIYKGIIENGRRYQTLKNEYSYPSDEQQFEAYEATHLAALVADSGRPNPLFQAPLGPSAKNILDVGTGKGSWAIDVADMFPEITVRGVDLFPPPVTWMPPNCILEVDDILHEWTWREKFDLIHFRVIQCAFTPEETEHLLKQCYDNLEPGGWIEHLELHPNVYCDDDSIPKDNTLFTVGPTWDAAGDESGRPMNIIETMRESIEKAGFIDVHEINSKWPLGPWPKDKTMKELGLINLQHWLTGLEGYAMHLFTKYGKPVPWSKEEVQVYVAGIRKELTNPRHHPYQRARRVWARKPLPSEEAEKTVNIKKEGTAAEIPVQVKVEQD